MASIITVSEVGGPRTITLDADQRRLFERELARIKRGFKAGKGIPPYRIAPGSRVVIRKNGKTSSYLLYDRSVLLQEGSRKTWQFYFGLLLTEWLFK
jgi:hypothetical protein